jgi:hypothetical protein
MLKNYLLLQQLHQDGHSFGLPRPGVIELFTTVIYKDCNKLVLFPAKPFQPSLTFASVVRACQSEAHFSCSTLG